MRKILTLSLILVLCLPAWADMTKYLIIFTDGTKVPCYILENDPPAKRLKIQCENKVETGWLSYYSIKAIIEASSQKDMTNEFIQPSVTKMPTKVEVKSVMDDNMMAFLVVSAFLSAMVAILCWK